MKLLYVFYSCCLISLSVAEDVDKPYVGVLFDKAADTFLTIPPSMEERIVKLCEGFNSSINGKEWESFIEEEKEDGGGKLVAIFRCSDAALRVDDHNWKMELLSNYIQSFERNRPQKWYDEAKADGFLCKDSYGRPIPMPFGVQRCHVLHYSNVSLHEVNNKLTFVRGKASGATRSPEQVDEITQFSCGDSVHWKLYSSNNSNILNDEECAVKVSLTSMHFFCCCYSNGTLCGDVGNLARTGLTCPRISMNATTFVNEGKWSFHGEDQNKEERIHASNLELQSQCHMKIAVRRPNRIPILSTSISLVDEEDKICEKMYQKIGKEENCHTLERQCYTDVEDELVYCCRFHSKDSENEDVKKEKILSIHAVYSDFVFEELKTKLNRLRNCLRPFGKDEQPYCIYFYDKKLGKFVNIQLGENYRVSDEIKNRIGDFLVNENEDLLYIDGELNSNDSQVLSCEGSNSLTGLPYWYRLTVAMVKCKTPESGERCDDFVLNETMKSDIDQRVQNQYECNIQENGTLETKKVWDMHCFEIVTSYIDDRNKFKVVLLEGVRTIGNMEHSSWSGAKHVEGKMSPIETYWCSVHNEPEKNGQINMQRLCICAAYKTAPSFKIPPGGVRPPPCNNGKFVENMHFIETSPKFEKLDTPSKCAVSSINEKHNEECDAMPEKQFIQSCVMGFQEGQKADIGCIREPDLSHGIGNHRMEKFDWHAYQVCNAIFNPDLEPFRCVLRDSKFKNYEQYSIICCCRSDSCDAAYKHAATFKPKKTVDFSVKK